MTVTWTDLPFLPLDFDEPPLCLSLLYTAGGGHYLGPLSCIDDAGHPGTGGPGSLHSGGSTLDPHRWSDADAADSLALYRASAVLTGPVCTDCEVRPQLVGGRCKPCARRELAADDIEMEDVA